MRQDSVTRDKKKKKSNKWKGDMIQLPEAISSMRGGNPSSEPPTTENPKRRSLGPRRTITTSGSSSTSSDALESCNKIFISYCVCYRCCVIFQCHHFHFFFPFIINFFLSFSFKEENIDWFQRYGWMQLKGMVTNVEKWISS